MASNLPPTQKENWAPNEIVKPEHTNSWGRAINTLSKAVPLYSACGNVYTATYTNNVYNLTPLSFNDNTSNVTVDSYVDGMSVVFQCPANNLANCSVNVNSLGAKTIKTIDNVNLPAGKLNSGVFVELKYDKTNDCFKFQQDFNKADRNFSNLTEEAEKHFLNKSQITNCLLEVPQRIKYTLENGTLTIKAGSVVIVPYGTEDKTADLPKGATFINDNFKVYDTQFSDGKFFVWAELMGDILYNNAYTSSVSCTLIVRFESYEISPIGLVDTGLSYNTSTNFVTYTNISETFSLPLMLCTRDTTGIGSVQQVFNGMGYIGSTIWVDKGVKGLIPNGRNADGTIKNVEVTTLEEQTINVSTTGIIYLGSDGTLNITSGAPLVSVVYGTSSISAIYPYLPVELLKKSDIEEITKISRNPIGQPQITLSNTLEDNEIWLEGATVSRTTYAELFKIYGTTYGTGDGSTTFVLPNFKNRAIWGYNGFGYIEAGLPNITGSFTSDDTGGNPAGAFYVSGYPTGDGGSGGGWRINLDASRSSSIYGKSSTVQPPAIKVRVKTRYK